MTDATTFNATILVPALAWFTTNCPAVPITRNAHVLMLAIAGQEGEWKFRIQHGNGPAHGFFQFERGGGVAGVLLAPSTRAFALTLCAAANVRPNPTDVWGLFSTEKGDNLAAAFARLLLWSDPASIPPPTDESGTYKFYARNWRPGKPRPADWPANIRAANAAVDV